MSMRPSSAGSERALIRSVRKSSALSLTLLELLDPKSISAFPSTLLVCLSRHSKKVHMPWPTSSEQRQYLYGIGVPSLIRRRGWRGHDTLTSRLNAEAARGCATAARATPGGRARTDTVAGAGGTARGGNVRGSPG